MITIEGIGKLLVPNIDLVEEARPFVAEMMAEKYNPKRLLHQSFEILTTASRVFREISQTAPQLLRDIEQGRLAFKVDLTQTENIIKEQRRLAKIQSRSIIVAASLICGTLAINSPGHTILSINTLSFTAFSLATLLGLPLVWSLFNRK